MNAVRTAIVIGGGIAGPVTALALRKAGVEATVYEAYASSADGIGGTLQVAPNGLDSLRIIGADKAVRDVGLPMVRTVMADGRGRRMAEFSGLSGLPPSRAMWRPELYRILHDRAIEAGVRIEYGRRLVGVDDGADTSTGITARFADGTTAHGDVLVGADGVRSTVRTLIDPGAPPPRHVPLLNIGATADVTAPGEPDATYFVFGRRAFLGYWLQPDGQTAWYSNLPHPQPMTVAQARAVPAADWLAKLAEVYADDVPGADLVRHTSPDELVVLGTVEMLPTVRRWHRGRMVLVGDSVHAPSPSSGQGASLAAESAIQLARCLRDIPDVPVAFAAYERLRRSRVEKVAAAAARVNSSKGMGPVAKALMSLLMPVATRTFLKPERAFGPVQRYRIDWDEKVTR